MQYYMNTVSVTRWPPKFPPGSSVVTQNSPGFTYLVKHQAGLMSEKYIK